MVREKPMQLTMVRADPTSAGGAVFATRAENCGESPAAVHPQKITIPKNKGADA
jgi:hypothetical protein